MITSNQPFLVFMFWIGGDDGWHECNSRWQAKVKLVIQDNNMLDSGKLLHRNTLTPNLSSPAIKPWTRLATWKGLATTFLLCNWHRFSCYQRLITHGMSIYNLPIHWNLCSRNHLPTDILLWSLGTTQQCCWRLKSSVMWHCDRIIVRGVWKVYTAFTVRVKQPNKQYDTGYKDAMMLWSIRNITPMTQDNIEEDLNFQTQYCCHFLILEILAKL